MSFVELYVSLVVWWLKESDGDFNGSLSQQASASDEDLEASSDSDTQRKKKRMRPEIPGERKSTRSRRVAGSMVRHCRPEWLIRVLSLCLLLCMV